MNNDERKRSRQTPYDDEYPSCERTYAELRIYSEAVDPDVITTQLGIRPTGSQRIGTTTTNSLGRTRTAKLNGWFLSSEEHVSSRDVRRHLDWLTTVLESQKAGLHRLQQIDGIRIGVTCLWWSSGGGGPTLWPEQMHALASLDLECSFDVYFFEADDVQDLPQRK